MAGTRTFTMIKPDAFEAGNAGAILKMIEAAGFKIVALKATRLSPALAGKFYDVHSERPFYKDLCNYMSSGAIIAAILEKENAVEDFRTLIGATNPANAAEGTIVKSSLNPLKPMPFTVLTRMKMQLLKEASSSTNTSACFNTPS